MNRSTILTTASGRNVDLVNPRAEDIDFADIAEHLAKENRYNGATPGVCYSVAQHLCVGADAVAKIDRRAAGYFLLHDAPEAYLKDDTTPKKRAIGRIAEEKFGVLAAQIVGAFDELTARWDTAIARAAGLSWPPPKDIAELVHIYDRKMLITEWRDFMRQPPPFDVDGVEPLAETILPWAWHYAARELLERFRRHLPALGGKL